MATPDTNPQPFSFAKMSGANRDIGFAVGMVLILAMLFIPLPAFFLDLGLAISLALSVLILMGPPKSQFLLHCLGGCFA